MRRLAILLAAGCTTAPTLPAATELASGGGTAPVVAADGALYWGTWDAADEQRVWRREPGGEAAIFAELGLGDPESYGFQMLPGDEGIAVAVGGGFFCSQLWFIPYDGAPGRLSREPYCRTILLAQANGGLVLEADGDGSEALQLLHLEVATGHFEARAPMHHLSFAGQLARVDGTIAGVLLDPDGGPQRLVTFPIDAPERIATYLGLGSPYSPTFGASAAELYYATSRVGGGSLVWRLDGGTPHIVASLDDGIAGMAWRDGTLWIASHDDHHGRLSALRDGALDAYSVPYRPSELAVTADSILVRTAWPLTERSPPMQLLEQPLP